MKNKKNKQKNNLIIHITRFYNKKKYGGIEEVIRQISLAGRTTFFKHVVLCSGKKNENFKISENLNVVKFKYSLEFFTDYFCIGIVKSYWNYKKIEF